jgi:hypothetical protein
MDVASRERSWLAGHPSDDSRRRRILRYPNLLHPSHSLSLPCAFHVWFYPFKLMGEDQNRKTESLLGPCAVSVVLPILGGYTTNGCVRP